MTENRLDVRLVLGYVLLGMVVTGCGATWAEPALAPTGAATEPPPTPTVAAAEPPLTPTRAATVALAPTLIPIVQVEDTLAASAVVTPTLSWEDEAMMLTVVFDNVPYDPRLQTGWGFAAWLEFGDRTVLFDTGADGAVLLANMATLGLDARAIDIVVLSHIHGDHTAGLTGLLAANPEVTVYLPRAFPAGFKEQVRAAGAEIVQVNAPTEILPGLWSTGQMGSGIVEQALVVRTEKGLLVITGCAHPGVDEMVACARDVGQDEVALVVGGFHLGGASQARIREIVSAFRRLRVQHVAPCHCTVDAAREAFRVAFGEKYHHCGVGWQW